MPFLEEQRKRTLQDEKQRSRKRQRTLLRVSLLLSLLQFVQGIQLPSKTVAQPSSSSNQTSPSSSLRFWATSPVISPNTTPKVKSYSINFHKVITTSTARRWPISRWFRMIENDELKDVCLLISDWSIRIHCQLVSEKFSWDSFIRFSRTEKWKEREQAQWTSWRMFFFNAWWIRSSPPTYCQNSPDNIWRELVVNNQKFFDFAQQGISRKLNEVFQSVFPGSNEDEYSLLRSVYPMRRVESRQEFSSRFLKI